MFLFYAITYFVLQFLEQEILLIRPTLSSGQHITGITLEVGEKSYSMKSKSKYGESIYLWSCTIKIPYKKLENHASFRFVAEITSSSRFHLFKRQLKWETSPYFLTKASVERVVWNTFTPKCQELGEHFKDIIVNCSTSLPLAECCRQVEDFSKKLKLDKRDAVEIYKLLLESLHKDCAKHWLLLLVFVSNIFRSAQIAADVVGETEINNILKILSSFRLVDLTSSSTSYLPTFLRELCRKALGDSFCFVMFVSATYPFLDEELLFEKLQDVVKERGKIVPNKVDNVEYEILGVIGNICCSAKPDEAIKLVEKLLSQFPVDLAVKAYAYMKQRKGSCFAESATSEMMLEAVKGSVKSFAKSSQRTISELAEVWATIESVSELSEMVKSEFESAVVHVIGKTSVKDIEKAEKVLLQTRLFSTAAQQAELIECLSNVRRPELHYVLFAVLMDPKFKEAAEKFNQKWFSLCIENGVLELKRSGSTEQKLKCVYTYFSIANEVPIIGNSAPLQEVLTTTAVEFLRPFELKVLMKSAKSIEELSAKFQSVVELFRHHLKALLSDQHLNNYYEILVSLCSTYGEIRVNSR